MDDFVDLLRVGALFNDSLDLPLSKQGSELYETDKFGMESLALANLERPKQSQVLLAQRFGELSCPQQP